MLEKTFAKLKLKTLKFGNKPIIRDYIQYAFIHLKKITFLCD